MIKWLFEKIGIETHSCDDYVTNSITGENIVMCIGPNGVEFNIEHIYEDTVYGSWLRELVEDALAKKFGIFLSWYSGEGYCWNSAEDMSGFFEDKKYAIFDAIKYLYDKDNGDEEVETITMSLSKIVKEIVEMYK